MKTTNWIPQPNELVRFNGKLFNIISINLDNKCTIKQFTSTKRIGKKFSNINISELQKID